MGADSSVAVATTVAASATAQQLKTSTPRSLPLEMVSVKNELQLSDAEMVEDGSQGRISSFVRGSSNAASGTSGSNVSTEAILGSKTTEGGCVLRPPPIATNCPPDGRPSSSINSSNSAPELSSGVNKGAGGTNVNRGVIPRICDFLFERARSAAAEDSHDAAVVAVAGGVEAGGGLRGAPAPTVNGSSSTDSEGSVGGVGARSGIRTRWTFG